MDDLTPIVIDLEKAKENDLDESFLRMFGWGIKKLLKAILGDVSIPVHLKGNPSDVKSFLGALGAETIREPIGVNLHSTKPSQGSKERPGLSGLSNRKKL